jgi:DNA-binding XRE family transcriptional regulator
MASPQNRTYLRPTREATELLGKLVRLGRRERKMTEEDLAGRAGISRRTLQKIERGDPKCEIGLVFEVANLVGVALFGEEGAANLGSTINRVDDKLALLPKRTRRVVVIDDDFWIYRTVCLDLAPWGDDPGRGREADGRGTDVRLQLREKLPAA